MPFLSVIIPAYNEADLIAETIEKSCDYLNRNYPDSEIVIVDDGSSDATAEIVKEKISFLSNEIPIRLISNGRNRGKGFSIKHGIEYSQGKHMVFFDADLPYDLNSIHDMVEGLENGYQVVVGSRLQPGAIVGDGIPPIRRLASQVYRAIVHSLIPLDVQDTQCGFKSFTSEAALVIFSQVTIQGFGFDIEALTLAQRLGYRIKAVPVTMLKLRNASRIKLARDAIKMFFDFLRVAWRYRSDKFSPAHKPGHS